MKLERPFRTRFLGSEDGSASVETVVLLPVFLLTLALITDATMIFHGQSQVMRIVQDANRAASTGLLRDSTETEAFVATALQRISPSAEARSVFDGGIVTTTVTMPAADLQILGTLSAFDGLTVTVAEQHVLEF